jgi:hypothetical protein
VTPEQWTTLFRQNRKLYESAHPGRPAREALEYAFRTTPACPIEYGPGTPEWAGAVVRAIDMAIAGLCAGPILGVVAPKLPGKLMSLYTAARDAGVAPAPVDLLIAGLKGLGMLDSLKTFLKTWGALIATVLALISAFAAVVGGSSLASTLDNVSKLLGGADPLVFGGMTVAAFVAAVLAVGKRFLNLVQYGPTGTPPSNAAAKLWWRWAGLIGMLGTIAVGVLAALGQADASQQVQSLLSLLHVTDPDTAGALLSLVPAVVAAIHYVHEKITPGK